MKSQNQKRQQLKKKQAFDAKRSSQCAVCDLTNATTYLCPACREKPENEGWAISANAHEITLIDGLPPPDALPVRAPKQENFLRTSKKQAKILQHAIYNRETSIEDMYAQRATPYAFPATAYGTIAARVGCATSYVHRFCDKFYSWSVGLKLKHFT